jgi:hypothetical protein
MAVSPDGYWSLWGDWGLLSPSNSNQTPSHDYNKGVIPVSDGRMVAPAWSPDGKWIAWTRRENGGWYVDFPNGDLYLTPFNDKRPIDKAEDPNCGDVDYGSSTYSFCRLGYSWTNARNYCLARGGDLVGISDVNENNFVGSVAAASASGSWWIGLNDVATEGNFVWSNGTPKTFTKWNGGEPNNSSNEDCAEILTGSYAWNDLNCGAGRYFVCESPKTWSYFGNTSMIAGADGAWDTNVFPSFSPDSQYVIYQAANAVRTRNNYGRLKLLNRASPAQKIDLYNANTATVMAASGAVSAVPDQDSIAYEPTFSPTESGGYYWAVFVSNRWYGNTIHPTWGVVKPGAGHLKDTGKKQMWVTAIPKNPGLAADPSTPPFWLPGQEYNNENMRGYFAKTPCKTSGQACKWDEDCCGNANGSALCVLDQPVTPAATRHCGSFTPGQCIQQGQACVDSSQCCQSPAAQECIQGLCTVPVALPFYTPAPFSRTYDSVCPSGTRVAWRNTSWKGLTPGDSSIEVLVQTGDSDADISAMNPPEGRPRCPPPSAPLASSAATPAPPSPRSPRSLASSSRSPSCSTQPATASPRPPSPTGSRNTTASPPSDPTCARTSTPCSPSPSRSPAETTRRSAPPAITPPSPRAGHLETPYNPRAAPPAARPWAARPWAAPPGAAPPGAAPVGSTPAQATQARPARAA